MTHPPQPTERFAQHSRLARATRIASVAGQGVVPREQWPTSRVRDHMVPLGDQVMVAPNARMDSVVGKLQDSEAGRVLVAHGGEVVGIITPSDLTRRLRRWRTLEGSAQCWSGGYRAAVQALRDVQRDGG